MKKILFHKSSYLTCVFVACFICFSCGGGNDSTFPSEPVKPIIPTEPSKPTNPSEPSHPTEPSNTIEKKHRTLILYMAGDNSLSHFLQNDSQTGDIDELLKGVASMDASVLEDNNLLVFIDKADSDFLPTVWRVCKHEPVLQEVKQFETDVVSSDPAIIQEVVDFAKNNYPADSYGFVYWSHGDGWIPAKVSAVRSLTPFKYIGIDQQNGKIKSDDAVKTNIADLAKVLESVGQKFEFVLFDACYMLSIEVAYELRNCAKYVIASPTETPGTGAPYDTLVAAMLKDSDVAQAIGKLFYGYYADRYDGDNNFVPSNNWHGGVAIGVINCMKLDALAESTDKGLQGVASVDNEVLRQSIFNYDRRPNVGLHYYFDMVNLMQAIMPATAFYSWLKAYQEALPYWQSTPKFFSSARGWFSLEGSHGISHYIPKKNDASDTTDIAYRSTAWYKAAGLSKLGW